MINPEPDEFEEYCMWGSTKHSTAEYLAHYWDVEEHTVAIQNSAQTIIRA